MKMLWKTSIFAMALFFVRPGLAAEVSVCSDPLARICQQTALQRQERTKYVEALKAEISNEAETAAAPRIAEMKKKVSVWNIPKRLLSALKIRNQEIMRAAQKRMNGIESIVTKSENIAQIKQYLVQAIDQSPFGPEVKQQFKDTIKSVVVGNFSDFIEKSGLENSVLEQIFSNPCGSSGLVDNAFATTLNNQKYVLICPGFLITLNQAASDSERLNSILQALAHEMGHHIDNTKFGNDIYAPYLSCLAKNHADQFNPSSQDKKFCKANPTDSAGCLKQVTESHAPELVADQWGILVTAIRAQEQSYSFQESNEMLSQSWAKLCGSGDEGTHPKGDFRIQTLMGKNAAIQELLRCDRPAAGSKPDCGFGGVHPL